MQRRLESADFNLIMPGGNKFRTSPAKTSRASRPLASPIQSSTSHKLSNSLKFVPSPQPHAKVASNHPPVRMKLNISYPANGTQKLVEVNCPILNHGCA